MVSLSLVCMGCAQGDISTSQAVHPQTAVIHAQWGVLTAAAGSAWGPFGVHVCMIHCRIVQLYVVVWLVCDASLMLITLHVGQ
jgi:hypothetical protein